jgi:hypothetical protein
MNTITKELVSTMGYAVRHNTGPVLQTVGKAAVKTAAVAGAACGVYALSFACMGVAMSAGPRIMNATYNATEGVIAGANATTRSIGNGLAAAGRGIASPFKRFAAPATPAHTAQVINLGQGPSVA